MKRLAKLQPLLGWATLLLLVAGGWLIANAPMDFQQGNSVRIIYLHVPSAKMSLLMYLAATACSVMYLWKKNESMDILAEAAVPVGALFTAVTLASGSIWGKPMWGTWWAWDARLTSMLVLLILYVGLMALRSAIDNPVKSAQATAVMVLIGAVDLPIIHFSVQWWRTLHQPASLGGGGTPRIEGALLTPLLVMAVAFIGLGGYLWALRTRTVAAQRQLDALEHAEEDHDDAHP
ncbi:MAG: cytochrome c biogenesis protein CcsA [Magnetococcales bacterium]|nr:cytochrome c biogenesis protein CcsA [Magnetococcales bacterium]